MSGLISQRIALRTVPAAQPEPLSNGIAPSAYFSWYAALHRALALALLLPATPIILLLVAIVRLSSPGPGIYRQIRTGRGGRTFSMYKIRTMRCDAESGTGPVWTAVEGDPRVTRLGRILRKLHLDEFPQLWNVVRGDMALVGPRPERPEFVQLLSRSIPGYLDRLHALPGITGLAQINLPPDSDLDSVRRKLIVDRDYIQHGSLWLDIRILACTLVRLSGLSAFRTGRLLALQRCVELATAQDASAGAATGPLVTLSSLDSGDGMHGNPKSDANLQEVAPRRPR